MLFKNIAGQRRLIGQLIQNVHSNRIGHAILLLGQEGSGHLPLALALAQYIQCGFRTTEDSCGACPSCLQIQKLEHPDLHFFFPTANKEKAKESSQRNFQALWRQMIADSPYFSYENWLNTAGIENKQAIINKEDCNNIIRIVGYKPYESQYKIILIYMPEKFYHAAGPVLLKTFEEPPEHTLFLLVSENRDQIINTILSRMQLIKVPLLSDKEIVDTLTTSKGVDADTASHIAFLSEGSYSEALRLLDSDQEPQAHFEQFRQWMRFCYAKDLQNIQTWTDAIARTGRERQKSFIQYSLKMFRLGFVGHYAASLTERLSGEQQDFLKRFAPFVNHNNTVQISEAMNMASIHLERNANARVLFTDLSLTMIRLLHRPGK